MKNRSVVIVFFAGVLTTVLASLLIYMSVDFTVITKSKYDGLTNMEEKYGKAEKIRIDLQKKYYLEIDDETIENGMYKGMFEAIGDKYSTYMTEDEFKDYKDSTNGNYVGIGILSDVSEDTIRVTRVFPNSPAEKAGIENGDVIFKVDDSHIDDVGYSGLISIMLGEEDTDVEVFVIRGNEKLNFNMKRGKVEIPFVSSNIIEEVGYIHIYKFGTDTSVEFKKHLSELKNEGIKGLIIDVRDNPGGLVYEATEISDELMGKGIIVYTLDKAGNKREYNSGSSKLDIPFIMLSNENSASASEILLGALQDTETSEVVGVQSFGKGIVQGLTNLKDGSGYKITFAQYFTPDGNNIHGIGIEPDYIVEYEGKIDGESPDMDNDTQLIKAFEILMKEILSN